MSRDDDFYLILFWILLLTGGCGAGLTLSGFVIFGAVVLGIGAVWLVCWLLSRLLLRPLGRLSRRLSQGQRAFVATAILAGAMLLPALLNVLHRPPH